MRNNKIYFISDVHLGINLPGIENRETDLIQFLKKISKDAEELFIVGDLFDFWIEYKHAVRPCYFRILFQFRKMIEQGIKITYIAGNHDFALGPFLEKEIGFIIIPNELTLCLQGKQVSLRHGDGIMKMDWGYRILRTLLRIKLFHSCYKILHPNIGVPLASFFSGSSRYFSSSKFTEEKKREYLEVAKSLLSQGPEILIMGHTHHPSYNELEEGLYCNTGEWMNTYSYGVMEQGKLSIKKIDKESGKETEL